MANFHAHGDLEIGLPLHLRAWSCAGKNVVLIESRAIGAGQTGKTTGQALRWWLDSFQEAENKLGQEKATVLASSLK